MLSLANRLYGEQSYQFVEVKFTVSNSRFAYGIEDKALEMIANSIDLLC